jgi:hypothetical protein
MEGLTYGGVDEDGACFVLAFICKCGRGTWKEMKEDKNLSNDKRIHTYGDGGKLAGSVSCGIAVQVSTQCLPFCHGYFPSTSLQKIIRHVVTNKHLAGKVAIILKSQK